MSKIIVFSQKFVKKIQLTKPTFSAKLGICRKYKSSQINCKKIIFLSFCKFVYDYLDYTYTLKKC